MRFQVLYPAGSASVNAEISTQDRCLEAAINEALTVRGGFGVAITDITQSGGSAATVDTNALTITPTAAGRSTYVLTAGDGSKSKLTIVCFASTVPGYVGSHIRPVGQGGDTDGAAKRRLVLRSLAAADWFDGTLASLQSGRPDRALSNYGA